MDESTRRFTNRQLKFPRLVLEGCMVAQIHQTISFYAYFKHKLLNVNDIVVKF